MSIVFRIPATEGMLTTLSALDELRGRWSGAGIPTERLARIAEASRIQSIASSCRMSGLCISESDVASALRTPGVVGLDRDEIQGYADALVHPLPSAGAVISTADLGRLNAILSGAQGASLEPSPWRESSLHREMFDANRQATGRIHSTLPPRLVAEKSEELVTWLEYELRARKRHPVLVIGAFVLGFLAASPYERYCGRMSKLLIGRLLERAGYGFMPYASVEEQIEELRPQFQEAIDRSQTRLWSGEADLEPWLTFLLQVLDRHRERVEAKISLERAAADYTPLQRSIVDTVREHGTVDAGLLLKATSANRNTLKDNLRRLVQGGILEKSGQRRGTRYRLAGSTPLPRAAEPLQESGL